MTKGAAAAIIERLQLSPVDIRLAVVTLNGVNPEMPIIWGLYGPGRQERTAAADAVRALSPSSAKKGDVGKALQWAAYNLFTPAWKATAKAAGRDGQAFIFSAGDFGGTADKRLKYQEVLGARGVTLHTVGISTAAFTSAALNSLKMNGQRVATRVSIPGAAFFDLATESLVKRTLCGEPKHPAWPDHPTFWLCGVLPWRPSPAPRVLVCVCVCARARACWEEGVCAPARQVWGLGVPACLHACTTPHR